MGITIQYRGQLKSPALIDKIRSDLKEIADRMGWEYTILDEDFETPTDARLEVSEKGCEIVGHLALKGISLNVHKDCSSFDFFFDADGILRDPVQMVQTEQEQEVEQENLHFTFVKTQFAPPDIHITLVKFLRYLEEKYFQTLDVIDEGNYWETGDEDLLKEKMEFLSQKMDAVSQALEDSWIKVEPGDSDLDILVKIEKVLREIDQ
ncbi:MAG: hypothetical protein GTO45_28530 [Candidatus Aminicenantes bacterium]|nr:hypothetical protein [Candidatus Aminicenantes bacterium]NIM82744.1 hypothetical protein [Candidatus Aminicenantes bacterium]NIN22121.1 hypothetical protein [Candidatus Aminicenantes bacterium]NIN45880.1 hypothetical protein [Candidatus Aminicenantes bacterium]NIN88717.1 hypothetical protein [Candidatus Aminicenantes bacterium]